MFRAWVPAPGGSPPGGPVEGVEQTSKAARRKHCLTTPGQWQSAGACPACPSRTKGPIAMHQQVSAVWLCGEAGVRWHLVPQRFASIGKAKEGSTRVSSVIDVNPD